MHGSFDAKRKVGVGCLDLWNPPPDETDVGAIKQGVFDIHVLLTPLALQPTIRRLRNFHGIFTVINRKQVANDPNWGSERQRWNLWIRAECFSQE